MEFNNQGQCPLCKGMNLEYYSAEITVDGVCRDWECSNCEALGSEWYTLTFNTHGNVCDKNGNEILNKEGY